MDDERRLSLIVVCGACKAVATVTMRKIQVGAALSGAGSHGET